jgi:PKD repeat protein
MHKLPQNHMKTGALKHFCIFLLVFASSVLIQLPTTAQVNCVISSPNTFPVCYGNTISLSTEAGPNLIYEWTPGGTSTPSISFPLFESKFFTVKVTDTITGEVCISAPFEATMHPRFQTTIQQMQLTCSNGDNDNGNTAVLKATAAGSTGPYTYEWQVRPTQIAPGNPSMAIGLKAHLWYFVEVRDIYNCLRTDSIYTRAYSNPVIEIDASPDTAFIQNPYVGFEFINKSRDTVPVVSHFWEFGDNSPRSELQKPLHVYTEVGDYITSLTVYNGFGCDTTYFINIKVLPIRLKIPNIITPNGDNINDVLIITEAPPEDENPASFKSANSGGNIRPLSAYYKKTSLVIFNRQGRKVYESTNYNNDWGGDGLKDGVYFYVLQCEGFKSNEVYRGSITIMGSGN